MTDAGGAGVDDAIRPDVARSWQRAELAGLHPESPGRLTLGEIDPSSRLMAAAAPVVADLSARLEGTSLSFYLADRNCRIVYEWVEHREIRRIMHGAGIMVGSGLDEAAAGNNGLGTAYETGHDVWINGAEHYLHGLKVFSCYGHPIRHPLTRRIEGALDITGLGAQTNPLFGPLLSQAARDIELRILEGSREAERRLFVAFQHATRHRSTPVAVLGGDVVLANRPFLDLLGTADPAILRALLPEPGGTVARELDLGPAGRVAVTAERLDGTGDGAIFRLCEPASRFVSGGAPAAPTAGRCALVAGEPGTGRTSAARELAGDADVVTMDGAAAVAGSERGWAARLVGLAARHRGVIMVDDVQVLPEGLCTVLRRAMTSSRARFVLVSGPIDELPPHAASLAARCPRHVELAPLRERLHELPTLLAEMGAAVRPDREWVLTPRALAAMGAQPWVGNLVELAALVDELAARPGAGVIDVPDLPERYRRGGRAARLGGLERAERAAIVRALRAAAGNKLRAAEQLGISRTTLYRRMHALDVPEDGG